MKEKDYDEWSWEERETLLYKGGLLEEDFRF